MSLRIHQYIAVCVTLLCFVTSSCRWFNPHALTKPPNESDLVGIWRTKDGMEVIQIMEDHTAIGTGKLQFARIEYSYDKIISYPYYSNIQGEWKIEEYPGCYRLNIYWKPNGGFKGFSKGVSIWDEPPPHTLVIYLGDPDNGDALFFYREKEVSNE